MRVFSTSFGLAALLVSSAVARVPSFRPFFKPPFSFPSQPRNAKQCTLTASGGDDAPHFLKAVEACPTVTIPKFTTLNIQTRMNMTGLRNRHIVSPFVPRSVLIFMAIFLQNLEGTIKFSDDIPYWSGNGFFIPFQTQITFWLLGGENILFDGGGTLDGSGQVR